MYQKPVKLKYIDEDGIEFTARPTIGARNLADLISGELSPQLTQMQSYELAMDNFCKYIIITNRSQ